MDSGTLAAALSIVVRLHGDTAPNLELLDHAQKRVTAILGHSGIDVRWRDCWGEATDDGRCGDVPAADEIVVRFLNAQAPPSPESCGVALVPHRYDGHFISLFTGCVRAAADHLAVAENVI